MQKNSFSEKEFNEIFKRALYQISAYNIGQKLDIKPNTYLREDLRLDSLDIMRIIIELETKYNIRTPDDKHDKIDTVGDMYKMFSNSLIARNQANTK